MLYIGVDLGTSAVKLLLMDETGEIHNTVTREYPLEFPRPGWSQQNPEDWWDAVSHGIPELLAGFDAGQVAGVGAAGQMHGLVILDEADQVIRPAILWNDGRTAKEVDYLNNVVGRERLSALTANIAFAGFTAPKLLWLRENEPENFARAWKWLDVKEYLILRCTGQAVMTRDSAYATFLYDTRSGRQCWSEKLCRMFGVRPEHLPRLADAAEKVGGLTEQAAGELTHPIRVHRHIGDGLLGGHHRPALISFCVWFCFGCVQ